LLLRRITVSPGKPYLGYVLSHDRNEHITYNAIKCQHERRVRRLKMAKFRLYDLRRTFLTRLGEANTESLHHPEDCRSFKHSG
jgi:hypothetical protein